MTIPRTKPSTGSDGITNQGHLPTTHASGDGFLQGYSRTTDQVEVLSAEVLQERAEHAKAFTQEDVDRDLTIATPPPFFSTAHELDTHLLVRDHIENIHGEELVVAVLDDAQILLVLETSVTQEWERFENIEDFIVHDRWYLVS